MENYIRNAIKNNLIVTLGTDNESKFAWCLRKVNNELMIFIHERNNGYSKFNENDYITCFPVNIIEYYKNDL